MHKVLKSMLQDGHNKSISSKTVITLLSFTMCAVGFIGNMFFKLAVDANMYNSLMYIVVAGLGFTASEKFVSVNKTDNSYDNTTISSASGTRPP